MKILFKIRLTSFFISDIALYYRSKKNITGFAIIWKITPRQIIF